MPRFISVKLMVTNTETKEKTIMDAEMNPAHIILMHPDEPQRTVVSTIKGDMTVDIPFTQMKNMVKIAR